MKTKIIVDIDIPDRDLIWSGICLTTNKNITILVNYDFENNCFNGYTIFKTKEIQKITPWVKNRYKNVRFDFLDEYLVNNNFQKCKTFYAILKKISSCVKLIAFFTENINDEYFVGKITSINIETANFRLINPHGEWIGYKKIKLKNINYFSFDTDYERDFEKNI